MFILLALALASCSTQSSPKDIAESALFELPSDLVDVRRVSVGDFNGDGLLDIAALARAKDTGLRAISLYHQDEDKGLVHVDTLYSEDAPGIGPAFLIVPDVNGDGADELAVDACEQLDDNLHCTIGYYMGSEDGIGPMLARLLPGAEVTRLTASLGDSSVPDALVAEVREADGTRRESVHIREGDHFLFEDVSNRGDDDSDAETP